MPPQINYRGKTVISLVNDRERDATKAVAYGWCNNPLVKGAPHYQSFKARKTQVAADKMLAQRWQIQVSINSLNSLHHEQLNPPTYNYNCIYVLALSSFP